MGIEIERKFTVIGEGWRSHIEKSVRMVQGYLNDMEALQLGTQKASVRIRRTGDDAYLNIKSREIGPSRQEYEYPVPIADAEALFKLCIGGLIDKIRHYLHVGGHGWEVDEFLGENTSLVIAEIELRFEAEPFEKPDWLGKEVTQHSRYYNLALAHRPYSLWVPEEKIGCW